MRTKSRSVLIFVLLCIHSLSLYVGAMSFTSRVIVAEKAESVPVAPIDGKPTLVYWDICGLAQSIRMALALGGADFVDVRIDPGSPDDSANYKQAWFGKKPAVGEIMPFPNLPYFMDETVCLSQSNTILKYIGRKYGLMGPVEKEYIVDLALDQLTDLDASFIRVAYPQGAEGLKVWCEDTIPTALVAWDGLLGSSNFLTGDSPTVADVRLYEVLRKIRIVEVEVCKQEDTSQVGGSTHLANFMTRMEAVPAIKKYMESSSYLARPLNNPHAKFL